MGVNTGQLNRRISLQMRTNGQDALGQPVQMWTEIAQVWADIRHQTGMEAIRADAQISTVRASIRVRYRSGLAAGMRVVHGSTVYAIRAVLPDETDRQSIDLACEVVT